VLSSSYVVCVCCFFFGVEMAKAIPPTIMLQLGLEFFTALSHTVEA
jgi:hypothetical protein